MKHLFFLFAISLILFVTGCSNDDQEIMPLSPNTSEQILQFDKTSTNLTHPFPLYYKFPEMKGAQVEWFNIAKGLVVKVTSHKETGVELFAVVQFADIDPAKDVVSMVYLGNSSKGTYIVRGLKNRIVSSIRVYTYNKRNMQDNPEPYTEYQLFKNISIKGWAAGRDAIKIRTERFPSNLRHIFAELTAKQGNTLIYLAKPSGEDFTFPKPSTLSVVNVRLVGYITAKNGNGSYPIISQQ